MARVAFLIGSRANWGSCRAVLRAVQERLVLDYRIVCFASAVVDWYGGVADDIEAEHPCDERVVRVPCLCAGDSAQNMVTTASLAMTGLSTALQRLEPDAVYVVGDRYEVLAAAYTATLLGIPIAHQMGGEVSGSVDDWVRDAVSGLATRHYPATMMASARLAWFRHTLQAMPVGCPRIDELRLAEPREPSILFCYHPDTNNPDDAALVTHALDQIQEQRSEAVTFAPVWTHILWPNCDAGNREIVDRIKSHPLSRDPRTETHRNMPVDLYMGLLKSAVLCVGNSSSFIREGAYAGAPTLLLGRRQDGRELGPNVYTSGTVAEILAKPRPEPSNLYGDGESGPRIARLLEEWLT